MLEDKTTKKRDSGRGEGWLGARDGPSDSRFDRGRGRVVAGVEKLHKIVVGKY